LYDTPAGAGVRESRHRGKAVLKLALKKLRRRAPPSLPIMPRRVASNSSQ
jgi:hypothetical protein